MQLKVIHFDDNVYDLEAFAHNLTRESVGPVFTVVSCSTKQDFLEKLRDESKVDLFVLDIQDQDTKEKVGLELASLVRSKFPSCVIVMRSSFTDPKTVAQSLANGADDFIAKTAERGELTLRLLNSYELARHKRGLFTKNEKPALSKTFVAGKTMSAIGQRVPRIIQSAVTAVHVHGEPGTGKEVVADLFRDALGANVPFTKVNCGAISPSLLESELFGHVKGAFTGAVYDRKGILEEVSGGWIFLDEIGMLPQNAQVALLRVIENQEIKPIGSSRTKRIDIRVISATNEDLEECVKKGSFRRDLWQRLVETKIDIPPLRERPQEIGDLIQHFCKQMTGGPYHITDATRELLMSYAWAEGNVRELRNCLRAMTEYGNDKTLSPIAIPQHILEKIDTESSMRSTGTDLAPVAGQLNFTVAWNQKDGVNFEDTCDQLLARLIFSAFESNNRLSIRGLAKLLGLPKTSLGEKLRKLIQKQILSKDDATRMLGIEW